MSSTFTIERHPSEVSTWQSYTARCTAEGCDYWLLSAGPASWDDETLIEQAKGNHNPRQHEPDSAPDIAVSWEVVATCSVCPDGGSVDQEEADTLVCSECWTTWALSGDMGVDADRGEGGAE